LRNRKLTKTKAKKQAAKTITVVRDSFLSPFRYPGGKSWFIKIARAWLQARAKRPRILIEPFAGGAGISLAAVNESLVNEAVFAELDRDVAAAWNCVLNGHAPWLTKRIRSFRVSRKRVEEQLRRKPTSEHERAFQCLLKNRTARGGVIAKGAGLIRKGDGRGLRSRWYPDTLAKRIEMISTLKASLDFRRVNGFTLIRKYRRHKLAVFFVDPPYTRAARRLYRHWKIDHERLFKELRGVAGDVLMTYDDTTEVRRWAKKYGFQVKPISMKTTHHMKKRELMIAKNFDWLIVRPAKR
jgi:DNA adenine methylase